MTSTIRIKAAQVKEGDLIQGERVARVTRGRAGKTCLTH